VLAVLLTGGLLWGLVYRPVVALHLLWDMVIPLLPALFLVNPMLWRNVCPLATLNQWTGQRQTRRLDRGLLRTSWAVGIILLAVLVPARHFLFNQNGTALAITIAVVAGLAVITGTRYSSRAGFCNSLCPILPVEKLYGQAPLVAMGGPRCAACDLCTPAGCIDLAAGKSARQSLGAHRGAGWLVTPFGVFAAAFPGFIVGYFTTGSGNLRGAGPTYLYIAGWTALSYLVVTVLSAAFRPRAPRVLLRLGACSVALYYWFAAPGLASAYGAPPAGGSVLRVVMVALVIVWFWRAPGRAATSTLPRGVPTI